MLLLWPPIAQSKLQLMWVYTMTMMELFTIPPFKCLALRRSANAPNAHTNCHCYTS